MTALPPRYTQKLEIDFSSHVPLGGIEAQKISATIRQMLKTAGIESPLRDTTLTSACFRKAVKNG